MRATSPSTSRSYPGDTLPALVGGLLSQGTSVRMQVTGRSMSPCIRSGDVVTIIPPPRSGVRLGDVVALSPSPGHLLVHRVVGRTAAGPMTWGDAAPRCDEPLAGRIVLGVVSRVQRAGRPVRLGLGPERLLIASAQRFGLLLWLRALAGRGRRIARSVRNRFEAGAGRGVAGAGPTAADGPADAGSDGHAHVPRGMSR